MRRRGPVAGLLAAAGAAAVVIASCTEFRGSLGDECIKDQDCLSGACTALRCVAAPSVLEAGLPPTEASTVPEASLDASLEDAPIESDVSVAPDGETADAPADAASETGLDAGLDAGLDTGLDTGRDAREDASADATVDAAADGATEASTPADTGAAADAPVDVRPGG
jgi:hypothetical protein